MNQSIKEQKVENLLKNASEKLQDLSNELWDKLNELDCAPTDYAVAGQIAGQLEFMAVQLYGQATGKAYSIETED